MGTGFFPGPATSQTIPITKAENTPQTIAIMMATTVMSSPFFVGVAITIAPQPTQLSTVATRPPSRMIFRAVARFFAFASQASMFFRVCTDGPPQRGQGHIESRFTAFLCAAHAASLRARPASADT